MRSVELKTHTTKAPTVSLKHLTKVLTQTVGCVNVNLPQNPMVVAFYLPETAATLTFKTLPLSDIM